MKIRLCIALALLLQSNVFISAAAKPPKSRYAPVAAKEPFAETLACIKADPVTPSFPHQQFDATDDCRSERPHPGLRCLDCHANGHANGATHLPGDVRPQEFRHRIKTRTSRPEKTDPNPSNDLPRAIHSHT